MKAAKPDSSKKPKGIPITVMIAIGKPKGLPVRGGRTATNVKSQKQAIAIALSEARKKK